MRNFLFLFLYLAQPLKAQFTISGMVASQGQPLPGATVSVQDTYKGTAAGAGGRYQLRNLPAGNYTLVVRFLGYEKHIRQVVLAADQILDFDLPKAAFVTDEVVVTATRASTKSGATYTNLSREELARQNLGQDLPFLLNQTPSVVVSSDAGAGVGYTSIRIRGSDPTRINVTINGIPLNDAESHGVFWVNTPDFASSVDNIQIQRGVGTSTNGAAAFGATVSVQTNTRTDTAYAELANGYGSFNTWRHTLKLGTGLLRGKWTVDGRFSKITSDGYMDRAASNLKSFYLSGGYRAGGTLLRLNVFSGSETTYQAWNGVPEPLLATNRTYNAYTYDNQTDNYQQDHYQFFATQELNRHWNATLALHYTRGRGYYEEYRPADELAAYGLPPVRIRDSVITATDLIRRRWLDNHFAGTVWSVNYTSLKRLAATFGGGWNTYRGTHYGEIIWMQTAGGTRLRDRYYDNHARKDDFNAYAKAHYDLNDRLNVFLDLQYRGIGYSFLGFDNALRNVQQSALFRFFNPKGGLTYRLPAGDDLYASYSVANREPTRDDFVQSTPRSRPLPERLRNVEAGIRRQRPRYRLAANAYLMDYRDQLVLTGRLNDVGAYTRTNIARSYRAGLELEASLNLARRWQLAANAALSRNRIRNYREFIDNYDTGTQETRDYRQTDIAFSPGFIAAGTLTYQPLKSLEISWLAKHVGRQYLDNTSSAGRRLDAFLVNDLRLNARLRPRFAHEITLGLLASNVFNHLYEPNGYTFSYIAEGRLTTENYYYPQAGRHFMASVGVRF